MTCLASSPAQVYRRGGGGAQQLTGGDLLIGHYTKRWHTPWPRHMQRTHQRLDTSLLFFFFSFFLSNIRDRASSMAFREHFCQGGTFRNETEKEKETLFLFKEKKNLFLVAPTTDRWNAMHQRNVFFFFGGSKKRTHPTLVSHHLYPPLAIQYILLRLSTVCVCAKRVYITDTVRLLLVRWGQVKRYDDCFWVLL